MCATRVCSLVSVFGSLNLADSDNDDDNNDDLMSHVTHVEHMANASMMQLREREHAMLERTNVLPRGRGSSAVKVLPIRDLFLLSTSMPPWVAGPDLPVPTDCLMCAVK